MRKLSSLKDKLFFIFKESGEGARKRGLYRDKGRDLSDLLGLEAIGE